MQSDTAAAQSTSCCPRETQAPADLTEVAAVQKSKTRRVSGDRAALGVAQKEAYYQAASLGGGTGVSALLTGDKARTDPQVAYTAVKQKAKAAAAVLRAGFEEWKKTKSLEVFTKTGAVVSITWGRVAIYKENDSLSRKRKIATGVPRSFCNAAYNHHQPDSAFGNAVCVARVGERPRDLALVSYTRSGCGSADISQK
jgi:hypothetical protein